MKKLIFVLSIVSLGFVSVSCSTDAYDLPDTEELKIELNESTEFILVEESNIDAAKDGEEDTSSSTDTETESTENTGPALGGVKKD